MAVAKSTKQFRHDAILMARAGDYCFVADHDDEGKEIPDRWILPGRPLVMKQTNVQTGETVGTYSKGLVVNTDDLQRFANSIGEKLIISDYPVARVDKDKDKDDE